MLASMVPDPPVRLTQFATGGGCASKLPPGELEHLLAGLRPTAHPDLLVGLGTGDDAAVVRLDAERAVVHTADFFSPVVDDPYDWGRIAASNALSDVYAMGGTPLVALNLVTWPRDKLPADLLALVLQGGAAVVAQAGCHLGGGHSIDGPEPVYGMAVTGTAHPDRLIRNDSGRAGLPLTLTKPLGSGVLNNRHRRTGEVFEHAVAVMTSLNDRASADAVAAGITCGTDVTGFGLLGHLYKLARASGLSAVVDTAAVPWIEGALAAADAGFVSGGTRRNLEWVRPYLDRGAVDETTALLLADAQTSGGLLLAGEVPGGTVIGELLPAGPHVLSLR